MAAAEEKTCRRRPEAVKRRRTGLGERSDKGQPEAITGVLDMRRAGLVPNIYCRTGVPIAAEEAEGSRARGRELCRRPGSTTELAVGSSSSVHEPDAAC